MTDKKPKPLTILEDLEDRFTAFDEGWVSLTREQWKELKQELIEQGKLAVLEMLESEETLELLANLEHEQWIKWSQTLAEKEKLTKYRILRWKQMWCPYSELTELNKDFDRDWAKVVVERLKSQLKDGEKR